MKTFFFIVVAFVVLGCQTNRIVEKQRHGLWIEKTTLNGIVYKSKGRYVKGEPVKTWRYFENGRLAKIETYKDTICLTSFFHPNGKVMLTGQTKIREAGTDIHWFYYGDWHEYDPNGKLTAVRTYENGEMVRETEIN